MPRFLLITIFDPIYGMNYHFSKPSLQLSPWVKQYWGLESCVPLGSEHIQRIVPNGLMELMFYLGNRPVSLDRNKPILENTIVSGQQGEKYDLQITGNMNLFSVTFQPQGAMMFFDIPISECYDQNIPLRFLIKGQTDELETRLSESACFADKIPIVENFLLQQLKRNFKKYDADRISKVIRCVNQTRGRISVGNLASEACLSKKQFERTFAGCIGASPKHFLRVVRFQHAIYNKQKKPNSRLSDLSYDCGFYDPAHMNNEFKALSGLTPAEFFTGCEAYSDYFS